MIRRVWMLIRQYSVAFKTTLIEWLSFVRSRRTPAPNGTVSICTPVLASVLIRIEPANLSSKYTSTILGAVPGPFLISSPVWEYSIASLSLFAPSENQLLGTWKRNWAIPEGDDSS